MHFAAYTIVPESVQRAAASTTATTPARRARCSSAASRLGCGTSCSPPPPPCTASPPPASPRRIRPTAPDQSLRHLQAHVGVDARERRAGLAADLRGAALFQRGRLGLPPAASARRPPTRHSSSRSPARPPSASAREVAIFGTDYPTPDGTGVRDYIHVEDLAAAPTSMRSPTCAAAAPPPRSTSATVTATACVRCSRASSGCRAAKLTVREEPRRAGDPPALVARAERIRALARLAAAPRRPRYHRAQRLRLGAAAAARAVVRGAQRTA